MNDIISLNSDGLNRALADAATNGAVIHSHDMYANGKQVRDKSIAEENHNLFRNVSGVVEKVQKINTTADQLGLKVDISTLAQISKEVIEQKLFLTNPTKFVPVKVGENPFYDQTVFYKTFKFDNNPEDGIVSVNNKGQFKEVEVGSQKFTVDRFFWAKQASWNFLQQSQSALVNQNLIRQKTEWLAENYAQFIQNVSFYGFSTVAGTGLLTGDAIPSSQGLPVTVNTALIAKPLTSMTATEINTFVQAIISAYQANNAIYEMPDQFLMPQSDFTGGGAFINPAFPLADSTFIKVLTAAFRNVTGNDNFQVIATPYCQKNFAANPIFGASAPILYNRYVLYKNQADSLEFDIPVPLTMLSTGTVNYFSFAQLAFAQTGQVQNKRTQDMLYLDDLNS